MPVCLLARLLACPVARLSVCLSVCLFVCLCVRAWGKIAERQRCRTSASSLCSPISFCLPNEIQASTSISASDAPTKWPQSMTVIRISALTLACHTISCPYHKLFYLDCLHGCCSGCTCSDRLFSQSIRSVKVIWWCSNLDKLAFWP